MRRFSIEEHVFKTEPLFLLGCDHATAARYLKRAYHLTLDAYDGQLGTMYTFPRAPHRIVWCETLAVGPVLHEVFHLVTRICQDKGVPIVAHHPDGTNGDEPAAYLFEFFAQRVLRRIR